MKRILSALVIGLSMVMGTAQADYLRAEDEVKFGQKNYFLIIASEKSTGLKPGTFLEDKIKIRKKYEEICNDQVFVWHTDLISSKKPKWGKGYWFVFSFVSDSKFSVSSAKKYNCVLKGAYVKSGTPTETFNGVSILASKNNNLKSANTQKIQGDLAVAPLLGSASAEPVNGFCLAGTKHSHLPISSKCSAAYEKGDYETALREFKPLANRGNAFAQYNLGQMYRDGEGVPQNDKTAVKYYTLAAEQGDTLAQSNLGYMYDEGQGVPKNDMD